MAQTHRNGAKAGAKSAEFIRESLEAAQSRIEHFEEEAQRIVRDLMVKGRASRKEFEQMVHRLSAQDWSMPEVKERIGRLRTQGAERAAEWREKAESFRAEALERLMELQGRAVSFLGVATRDQVEELSKEIDRLAKRIEKSGKPRRPRPRAAKGS